MQDIGDTIKLAKLHCRLWLPLQTLLITVKIVEATHLLQSSKAIIVIEKFSILASFSVASGKRPKVFHPRTDK